MRAFSVDGDLRLIEVYSIVAGVLLDRISCFPCDDFGGVVGDLSGLETAF